MSEKNGRGRKAPSSAPRRGDAEIERAFDAFEQALRRQDAEQIRQASEQLWTHRRHVPAVLTRRVIEGRAEVPALAMEMIGGFAGPSARKYLMQIANDPNASDIVRFGAHRRAGWPERGEAKRRLAFLDSLKDPDATLVAAIDQGSSPWPPYGEVLTEVLGYFQILPPLRRQVILTQAVRELGPTALWILHALLHLDDQGVQQLAIQEIENLHDAGGSGPLNRLAATSRDPQLRDLAAKAAQRLAARPRRQLVPDEPIPFLPLDRALLSPVDGAGAQAILVVHQIADGLSRLANFLLTDTWGIKDTYGTDRVATSEVDEIIEEFAAEGVELIEVDLSTVRGALQTSLPINHETGHLLPLTFEIWEPSLHETYPPAKEESAVPPTLDDAAYRDRTDLLAHNDELFNHRFFDSWAFDPSDIAIPLVTTPIPIGGRSTARDRQRLVATVLEYADRERLRGRLRRQAWLLDRIGSAPERDLALATAAALGSVSPEDLARQPFFQQMVSRAIDDVLANLTGR